MEHTVMGINLPQDVEFAFGFFMGTGSAFPANLVNEKFHEGIRKMWKTHFLCILLWMPDTIEDGASQIQEIRDYDPCIPIICIDGHSVPQEGTGENMRLCEFLECGGDIYVGLPRAVPVDIYETYLLIGVAQMIAILRRANGRSRSFFPEPEYLQSKADGVRQSQ